MLQSTAIQYYAAYAQAQDTVPKTRQVVMLYDGVLRFIRQARQAGEQQDYEKQYSMLDNARTVILALHTSLDFEKGGEVCRSLDTFYQSLYIQLFRLHVNEDNAAWDGVIANIVALKEAWEEVEKKLL